MSVPEEETQELGVEAAGGAGDEMGCTMGCMISGPIATMTADGADGDAESDITVPIVASVTCSWLPPVALPSIDMREPRER